MNHIGSHCRYSERAGIVAPDAGWVPPIRYLLRRTRILALLRKQPAGKLLEIGCGAGALLCDLTRRGHVAQGLETSPQALSMAARLAKITASPHHISSAPRSTWESAFNIVCAFDVLEHINDDRQAIQDWTRWLAPNGKMMLSVPAHRSRWGSGDVWAGHYRRYDRSDIQELVASCGMEIEHFECYGFPLANATEFFGNLAYRRMIAQRTDQSKEQATASSGVDRRSYTRLIGMIDSLPGQVVMSGAMALQTMTNRTNWGSGYLLMASRR
jgi:SAM-dependent methyltransferase